MTPLPEAVSIPFVQQFLDDDRTLQPNDVLLTSSKAMLDELVLVTKTLAPAAPAGQGIPDPAGLMPEVSHG